MVTAVALAVFVAAGCSVESSEAGVSTPITAPVATESASTATAPSTTAEAATTSSTAPTSTTSLSTTAGEEPTSTSTTTSTSTSTSTANSQPSEQTCTVHDDRERCWLLQVPSTAAGPAPLVIDFHGWTSNARSQRSFSGFDELAEREGFFVVWPDGYRTSFNAGGCCPPANNANVDDVDFTRLLVSTVSADHEIDLDRVYVTGLSNGCAMAQRIAADASDLVAAVACMSLYLLDEVDSGYTAVPVMALHGTNDAVVAYEPSIIFDGAEKNLSTWARLNGCSGEPAETWRSGASVAMTYQTCDGGSEVSLVTIDGGRHLLYGDAGTDIDTTRLAWDFMRRFTNNT